MAPDELTSAHRFVVSETLPDVPVTVKSYAPAVVEDVVDTVNVEVCAVVLLNVIEVVDRPHVAALVALEGVLVTEHASVTVPVNELPGVTVIVEVLLDVAPGATLIFPLLVSLKLVLLGASQKPLHPERKGATISASQTQLPIFIAVPLNLRSVARTESIRSRTAPRRDRQSRLHAERHASTGSGYNFATSLVSFCRGTGVRRCAELYLCVQRRRTRAIRSERILLPDCCCVDRQCDKVKAPSAGKHSVARRGAWKQYFLINCKVTHLRTRRS